MSLNTQSQPSLADLMMRFVSRPIDAASIEAEAGALGEVEPHEVAVGFRADPRLAWQEGVSVLTALGLKDFAKPAVAPSEWAAVVVRHESIAAQPFALGAYPQRVRDLTALLQAPDLANLRQIEENRPVSEALRLWAVKLIEKGNLAHSLQAIGVLRAAHDFDFAEKQLNELRGKVSGQWQTVLANEEAALLWQRGAAEKAAEIWSALPDSPAVFFNRGMAALFLNQPAKARECLKKTVELLPESNGWHHLGSLYLALAEIRS
jgi:tetratricopeptide (TPR) repeat protein